MTKQELVSIISNNLKMLRAEHDYSQQAMANAIGISKKTLIQIEKGRLTIGWTGACAVCSVFRNSKILRMTLGDEPPALAEALAHKYSYAYDENETRGTLFWDILQDNGRYAIQKNIISEHYKITDKDGKRLFSSFDEEKINAIYTEYIEKGEKEKKKMNNAEKMISVLRWTTRILSILIALLFLVFFIGEADFTKPFSLSTGEVFMILSIPVLLIAGIIVAWKREILGGIIIIISVLFFNIAAMISEKYFTFELEFGLFLFLGLMYVICGVSKRRLSGS